MVPIDAPLLRAAYERIADYRFVAQPVLRLLEADAAYAHKAEDHLAVFHRSLGGDGERFDDAVDAFVEMTFDVMRMQERFYRTGEFAAGPEIEGGGSLYDDPDVMGRRYLCGLYLAQVFWPNHLEKLAFFDTAVLPRLRSGMRVLEVGTGPGTYGLSVGREVGCSRLILSDISSLSIEFARRMADAAPVLDPAALTFEAGDFLAADWTARGPFDLVIFSEVVEHLPEPEQGMRLLRACLDETGFAFFSTATNAAFYDHSIVFDDLDEIERLLDTHGFEVIQRHTILAAEGPDGRDVVDFNAVIRVRSTS